MTSIRASLATCDCRARWALTFLEIMSFTTNVAYTRIASKALNAIGNVTIWVLHAYIAGKIVVISTRFADGTPGP